jgi:hypothetical protein
MKDTPLSAADRPKHGIEERFKLKRMFLLSILAVIPAALMPLAATSQVAPSVGKHSADRGERTYKYEVYAGFGYTTLAQINQSHSGLMGVEASVTRDFGKYFGLTADGGYYKYAYKTGNPGNPSVETVLFGPVIHANLIGHVGAFVHGLIGGEHTGGESMTPNISFAGGVGGGLEYSLGPRLSLRASGDEIGAAFTPSGNTTALAYSPHTTWNPRASFGAVYRF